MLTTPQFTMWLLIPNIIQMIKGTSTNQKKITLTSQCTQRK